jgi:hypothetical protein
MAKQALYKETSDDPLGARLYLTSYRVLRHAEQTLAEYDMTFHSYLALYYIDKIPRISIKDLCEYVDVSQSIISRTVQNLQTKKCLKKRVRPIGAKPNLPSHQRRAGSLRRRAAN